MENEREFAVMAEIRRLLADLDGATRVRIIRWLADLFEVGISSSTVRKLGIQQAGHETTGHWENNFPDLASLFHATSPAVESDKALVAGYWFQKFEAQTALDSQRINSALKQLGHGVSNITRALDDLTRRKPQLVIQVQKSGTSKQARKKYRLTDAGLRAVKQMINGEIKGEGIDETRQGR